MDLFEPSPPRDLVSLLVRRSRLQPEHLAYNYEDGQSRSSWTYAELDQRARAIAASLGPDARGERALLLYPPGLEFLAGFFGCLYAGAIAVPAYPPRASARPDERTTRRIRSIVADARPRFLLTTASVQEHLDSADASYLDLGAMSSRTTDKVPHSVGGGEPPRIEPDSIAFLQYTSGSTGSPKGVCVSHGNIVANEAMICHGFQHSSSTVFGSWLPVFHDMGLIGNILQPLYLGVPCHFIAPAAFIKHPRRWLELITRHRVTTTGAPDFAYRLCVDGIAEHEREGLDLSSWSVAYNGAEPVRAETLRRFTEAFAPHGFSRSAFYVTYGLAEATLFVSGGDPSAPPRVLELDRAALDRGLAQRSPPGASRSERRTVVSCGRGALGQQLVIVAPETREPVPDGVVGEVWLGGDHVTSGYWQNPHATAEYFGHELRGYEPSKFYSTGDFGFMLDGELYITGRSRDLIVVRGVNHYAEDIEQTVCECDDRVRVACAVGTRGAADEERLALVVEVGRGVCEERSGELVDSLRASVATVHGLELTHVSFVKRGRLPRTTSGKVQRQRCRSMVEQGKLDVVAQWNRASQETRASSYDYDLEAWLLGRLSRMLCVAPHEIELRRPLVDYGIDSAASVMLTGELESRLDLQLPETLAWDYPSVYELVSYLSAQ